MVTRDNRENLDRQEHTQHLQIPLTRKLVVFLGRFVSLSRALDPSCEQIM